MSFRLVKLLDPIQTVVVLSGLVPKGAYDAGTDYDVGDVVSYQGSSYVMYVNAAAGTTPTDTTKWMVLASKGDAGATGATGPAGSTATVTDTFVNADLVAGVFTFNHALNARPVNIQVFDNNWRLVVPDSVELTDVNNAAIDLTSWGAITGTWRVVASA